MKKQGLRILILMATLLVIAVGCSGNKGSVDSSLLQASNSGKIAPMENLTFDWGKINIEGGFTEHLFKLKNEGENDLIIKTASTSCMCTNATIKLKDGTLSPQFGMHQILKWGGIVRPNEEFEVKVVFDPMAHGPNAVGPIERSINLVTSSMPNGAYAVKNGEEDAITEIRVSGDVLYAKDYIMKDNMQTFKNISVDEFRGMQSNKNFFLLDVHIPEQEHIENTDAFIPYNELDINLEKLPQDKNTPIVVYCRSGNMSIESSMKLVELGYKNVYNLEGGRNAYIKVN